MKSVNAVITEVTYFLDPEGWQDPVRLVRVGQTQRDGTFDPRAGRWAIRRLGQCLTNDGEWVWEPLPSSRSDEFKEATRFTFAEAVKLGREAVEQLTQRIEVWHEERDGTQGSAA